MTDTEHANSNSKHFYSGLRESLLSQLAVMLEENNSLVNSFMSLRNLIQSNEVPDDEKLVIRAHERAIPGHVRKCNVPKASEVAALVVDEQYGKLDIVLRLRSEYDANGFEKLELINMGNEFKIPMLIL